MGRLSKCCQLLSSISDALVPNNLHYLQATLPYIMSTLEKTLQSIESTMSSIPVSTDHSISNFKQSFQVVPGQNLDKQLKFYRSTQKCGRKRQDVLRYD